MGAEAAKLDREGSETPLPPMGGADLASGELIRGIEAGGGGYGNPLERDPDLVVSDVLEGWVSADSAEHTYGVVLRGSVDDGSLTADRQETDSLRRRLENENQIGAS
jgi:N-methylhydantoinase B